MVQGRQRNIEDISDLQGHRTGRTGWHYKSIVQNLERVASSVPSYRGGPKL